ncbi:RagB/SusD family nutrient uptake outer membrane protein [Arenibacter sp. M-2]|uniref:RagB/SusD family nutrient uptake outer membrane protein n=1 Tax=Arenibacter sp. M-2 TaxID=3053612 RepID=UPI00257109A5|nr:RagB/SusD family nutrient uptake outer membrane protein [Arenibacter sp. M-2]MDL5514941.1 RagB/SusD family nutrient uptake outer membrane protein [Arenibacter sp. M-2]
MMLLFKNTIKSKTELTGYTAQSLGKIFLTLLLLVSFSCSSELDLYPGYAIAPEDLHESDLSALRLGMYNQVQNDPSRESFIMFDILGGQLQSVSGTAHSLINNTLSPLNSSIVNSWAGYYSALYQVNNVLGITKDLPDSELKTRTQGEAHFFRAYIYSNLVIRWGAVPILEENTMEKVARNPKNEVWAFIEKELNLAETLLDNSSESYYMLSKNAVIALRARVMLHQGKMAEAVENAEYIINQTNHRLDSFDKIFREAQNDEIIFAFENRSEESSITISTLFYSYAHPNKGSWIYRPTTDLMKLYSNTDLRREISITSIDGNDMVNKYPSGQTGTDPFVVLRLAEMYLISAEAQGVNGGVARLNELRNERGLDNVFPGNEDAFVDDVLLERKKEFLGEGFLYYDLVRTDKAIDELGLLDYQQLFPIPGEELLLNENLTPNPGY